MKSLRSLSDSRFQNGVGESQITMRLDDPDRSATWAQQTRYCSVWKTTKCMLSYCPFDTRIATKQQEKVNKHSDLKPVIKRLWKCRDVLSIIIRALGTVQKGLIKHLNALELIASFDLLPPWNCKNSEKGPRHLEEEGWKNVDNRKDIGT